MCKSHYSESQGITKISRIHPLGIMNVCDKFHGNLSNLCWDISVLTKDWPTDIAIHRAMPLIRLTKNHYYWPWHKLNFSQNVFFWGFRPLYLPVLLVLTCCLLKNIKYLRTYASTTCETCFNHANTLPQAQFDVSRRHSVAFLTLVFLFGCCLLRVSRQSQRVRADDAPHSPSSRKPSVFTVIRI